MSLDKLIFKNKKFADLIEEIYDNQKRKEKQISTLISELRPLIEDTGDATLIVPLIKEYLEIGVKNDDQLVKVATIIQRTIGFRASRDEELEGLDTKYHAESAYDITGNSNRY